MTELMKKALDAAFNKVSKYGKDTKKSYTDRVFAHYLCLNEVVENIGNTPLRVLCHNLINSPYFLSYPASIDKHHNYPGGLLVHTSQTVNTILNMQGESQSFDSDAAVTSAIFHDVGKLSEYTYEKLATGVKVKNPFKKTEWGLINGHVSASAITFMQKLAELTHRCNISEELPVPLDTLNGIEHAILSHHGRPEWGSLTPKTQLAWALHLADMASVFTFKSEYKEVATKKKSSSRVNDNRRG